MKKLFLVSKRIASFKKRILVIGSQGVNKQSQDFAYPSKRLFQP